MGEITGDSTRGNRVAEKKEECGESNYFFNFQLHQQKASLLI